MVTMDTKIGAFCSVLVLLFFFIHVMLQTVSVSEEEIVARNHLTDAWTKTKLQPTSESVDESILSSQEAKEESVVESLSEGNPPYLRKSDCTKSQKYGCLEAWLRREGKQVSCTLLNKDISKKTRLYDFWNKMTPDKDSDFSMTAAWMKPEMPSAVDAPRNIPEMYKKRFTMNGKVRVTPMYRNQAYLGSKALTTDWTEEFVNDYVRRAKKKELLAYVEECLNVYAGIEKYQKYIKGKVGIVIGSEKPWVEAILLLNGAKHVLTLEFGARTSTHPQISTIVPPKFTEAFLNRQIGTLDFGISYSSLEHDGMGRYGDVLNPEGDLQSMTRMRSVIKPGGIFMIGVPVKEADSIYFNAHREYGALRIPKLLAGWKLIDVIGTSWQPFIVLQNLNGCSGH